MPDEPMQGKIAKIIDERTVILNVGWKNGVKDGMTFVIYDEGDEVKDPDTGESLGQLEIIKGRVIVVNTQERMSTASPPPRVEAESSGTLSSLMAEVSKGPYSGSRDRREPLVVRTSDISGMPQVRPIAVGDRVRSTQTD